MTRSLPIEAAMARRTALTASQDSNPPYTTRNEISCCHCCLQRHPSGTQAEAPAPDSQSENECLGSVQRRSKGADNASSKIAEEKQGDSEKDQHGSKRPDSPESKAPKNETGDLEKDQPGSKAGDGPNSEVLGDATKVTGPDAWMVAFLMTFWLLVLGSTWLWGYRTGKKAGMAGQVGREGDTRPLFLRPFGHQD